MSMKCCGVRKSPTGFTKGLTEPSKSRNKSPKGHAEPSKSQLKA